MRAICPVARTGPQGRREHLAGDGLLSRHRLILCGLAVNELDEVHGLYSYGAGLPEPACAGDNPLHYKITWTFEGVLNAYRRPARLLKDGVEISIPGGDIFRQEHVHSLDIPGLGRLEAYPNGDAIDFIRTFGLGPNLKHMGRFKMRWPGHCRFWERMSDLGFLSDEPLEIDGCEIAPFRFLVEHLTPPPAIWRPGKRPGRASHPRLGGKGRQTDQRHLRVDRP